MNTNMKINDIAKEVGYPDTSYFLSEIQAVLWSFPGFPEKYEKILKERGAFMNWKHGKRAVALGMGMVLAVAGIFRVSEEAGNSIRGKDLAELTWYQVGDRQKDDTMVLEAVNEYLAETIGVKLNIIKVGWGDYSQKMQVVIATEDEWDLCFTSS